MLRDGPGDIRDDFGILGLPETFVVDRRGRIAAVRARTGRRARSCASTSPRCSGSAREAPRRGSGPAWPRSPSPAAALAADCPQTTLGDIEDEVMCPICGTPLGLATEAPQAQRERAFIERLIADCRSKDEIKRALVAQFGEGVLALPGDAGDDDGIEDVLVYVIPALGLLLAARRHRLRRSRAGAGDRRPRRRPAAAADSSRVDVDMERYDL